MKNRKTQENIQLNIKSSFTAEGIILDFFIDNYIHYASLSALPMLDATPHMHEYYEFFVAEDASVVFSIEDNLIELKKGECLIINPKIQHLSNITRDPAFKIFGCAFSLQYCDCNLFSQRPHWVEFIARNPYTIFANDHSSISLLYCLKHSMQYDNGQSAAVYLYALLTRLFDLHLHNTPKNVLVEDTNSKRLLQIDNMLTYYFNSNISLSHIAEQLHLSERQIARIIKEQYNCSFRDIIIEKRMTYAKDLLKRKMHVSEIAEASGYSSTKTFQAAFLKHVGVTPAKYRKLHS